MIYHIWNLREMVIILKNDLRFETNLRTETNFKTCKNCPQIALLAQLWAFISIFFFFLHGSFQRFRRASKIQTSVILFQFFFFFLHGSFQRFRRAHFLASHQYLSALGGEAPCNWEKVFLGGGIESA